MNALLRAALLYTAQGWPLFALHGIRDGRCTCGENCGKSAGKHPRTQHGFKDATTDPSTITRWWGRCPDANIGIATGIRSGILVIDVDDGGEDTLRDLERRHGRLPETGTVLTGGGGRHLFFRHPGFPIANKVRCVTGIDVRGDGGYVVAPPSLHLSGKSYTWEISFAPDEIPLAAAPAWLLAIATAPVGRAGGPGRLSRDGAPLVIAEGERNDKLMRIGAALRRYGVGEEALVGCLHTINREHCRPPLGEREVRQIAASVGRYQPAAARQAGRVVVG